MIGIEKSCEVEIWTVKGYAFVGFAGEFLKGAVLRGNVYVESHAQTSSFVRKCLCRFVHNDCEIWGLAESRYAQVFQHGT